MSEALYRATLGVEEEDLPRMVLVKDQLPLELQDFLVSKEGVLDNETMAEQGLPGTTVEGIAATGRATGYIREYVNPMEAAAFETGSVLMAASVVHLFEDRQEVSRWMNEEFLEKSKRFAGQEIQPGQHLISVDHLRFDGFSDESVGLSTLQATPAGLISSNVVDFRVGRLLGVAYLVLLGEAGEDRFVNQMGLELERRIVRVILGVL